MSSPYFLKYNVAFLVWGQLFQPSLGSSQQLLKFYHINKKNAFKVSIHLPVSKHFKYIHIHKNLQQTEPIAKCPDAYCLHNF
jgi:hypothetical protein